MTDTYCCVESFESFFGVCSIYVKNSKLIWNIVRKNWRTLYRGADKSLAWPGRKQSNISVRMAWISFGALPCMKSNLMTGRVPMLLKSRDSLTCFRACFLPGRAKGLSEPLYIRTIMFKFVVLSLNTFYWLRMWHSPEDISIINSPPYPTEQIILLEYLRNSAIVRQSVWPTQD